MSFTSEVKSEIARYERSPEAKKAMIAALLELISTMDITSKGLQLTLRTENPTTAKSFYQAVKELYHVETEQSVMKKAKLKKNRVYIIRIKTHAREIMEDLTLWTKDGLQQAPSGNLTRKRECAQAYLAGCFLATGSVNAPTTAKYHLEIATNHEEHAKFIVHLLEKQNLPAKMTVRRKQFVVYIKSVNLITDFLAFIGSTQGSFEYADVQIGRDYVQSIVRTENCDTANAVRSMQAATQQMDAIEWYEEHVGLDNLDEKLLEVALLRKKNPEASLNELVSAYERQTGIILGKSGIKHRLAKLMEVIKKAKGMEV